MKPPHMNRRDTLSPRRLAQTAGQVLATLEDAPVQSVVGDDGLTLLRCTRRAMATGFEVALPLGTPGAHQAAAEALDLVDRLEDQLTVYRDHSEVSQINRYAALSLMPVEPELFALLERAAPIHAETQGAQDIAVGALIKTWGFYRRSGQVPSDAQRVEALARSGMRHVVLDHDRRTIRFRQHGVEINLGSIGKGYALDRVAQQLRLDWNIHCCLLHGGTSSVIGVGAPGRPRGWPVGLGDPNDMNRKLGKVWLRDRALGTSSKTFQHFMHNGRKLGHLLDPRTGWPAEQLVSATAIAPTAADADALATAFFVLGVEETRLYCQKHPDVGAVLLPNELARPIVLGNVDFD